MPWACAGTLVMLRVGGVSEAVREAITEHIAKKRSDKAFRDRLKTVMERDREILERLAR